jgi:probable HAF family extracellular repeat protein
MTELPGLAPGKGATAASYAKPPNQGNPFGIQYVTGYGTIGGETHAFLMTPIPSTYSITEIPLKPSTWISNSLRINNRSQVVGESASGFAAVWNMANNVVTELTNVPSQAYDINEWGEIVGESAGHAFYYGGRSLIDLGTLGGLSSVALGIDNTSPASTVGKSPASVNDTAFLTCPFGRRA